jgi:hypothetical protein
VSACSCRIPHAGGGGCPAFVRGFADELKRNREATSVIAGLCLTTSVSLTASIFLAPLAPPVAAVGALLFLLLGDCEAGATVKVMAREAVAGCDVLISVLAVFGVASLGPAIVSAGLGLTATAGVAVLIAAVTGLRICFNMLAGGNAPTTAMVVAVVGPLVAVAGLQPSLVRAILDFGVSQSEKLPSSDARRKAGTNAMSPIDIEKDFLRRLVRAAEPKTVWRDAPAVIAGDFRPLVVAGARFRAGVRQKNQGAAILAGKATQNIAAVQFLAALTRTAPARWTQADALAAITDPTKAPAAASKSPTMPSPTTSTSSATPLLAIGAALVAAKILL